MNKEGVKRGDVTAQQRARDEKSCQQLSATEGHVAPEHLLVALHGRELTIQQVVDVRYCDPRMERCTTASYAAHQLTHAALHSAR